MANRTYYNRMDIPALYSSGQPDGPIKIDFPFADYGDTTTLTISRDYLVKDKYYTPLKLDSKINLPEILDLKYEDPSFDFGSGASWPVDLPLNLAALNGASVRLPPNAAKAILVSQGAPQDAGGGLARVARTYATIPLPRNERAVQSATFFGYSGAGTGNSETAPCNVEEGSPHFTVSGFPDSWQDGARISVKYSYEYWVTGGHKRFGDVIVYGTIFGGVSKILSVTFSEWNHRTTGTTATLIQAVANRDPYAANADGFNKYTYAHIPSDSITNPLISLVGMKVAPPNNILTASTSPTVTEYQQWIRDKRAYQFADTSISRWMGNIYQIITPFVFSQ